MFAEGVAGFEMGNRLIKLRLAIVLSLSFARAYRGEKVKRIRARSRPTQRREPVQVSHWSRIGRQTLSRFQFGDYVVLNPEDCLVFRGVVRWDAFLGRRALFFNWNRRGHALFAPPGGLQQWISSAVSPAHCCLYVMKFVFCWFESECLESVACRIMLFCEIRNVRDWVPAICYTLVVASLLSATKATLACRGGC